MSGIILAHAREMAAKAIARYRREHKGRWDYSAWQALEEACQILAQSAAWSVQADDIKNARIYAQVMTDLEASQQRLIARREASPAVTL